jgi:hypothetical protein
MAKHCTNCGHELREGDKFCSECGTVVGGAAAQARPTVWDYCEIFEVYLRTDDFFSSASIYHFVAVAVTPTQDRYNAGESGEYGWKVYKTKKGILHPQDRLAELTQKLLADGWEPLSQKGENWYSYTFRRPVKR